MKNLMRRRSGVTYVHMDVLLKMGSEVSVLCVRIERALYIVSFMVW